MGSVISLEERTASLEHRTVKGPADLVQMMVDSGCSSTKEWFAHRDFAIEVGIPADFYDRALLLFLAGQLSRESHDSASKPSKPPEREAIGIEVYAVFADALFQKKITHPEAKVFYWLIQRNRNYNTGHIKPSKAADMALGLGYAPSSRTAIYRWIKSLVRKGFLRPEGDGYVVSTRAPLKPATARRGHRNASKQLTRVDELAAMPYPEYLLTPEWQSTRRDALERSGNRCQVCNSATDTLDVHHRTYKSRGHERHEDLIVLCRSCHGVFHQNGRMPDTHTEEDGQ